MTTVAVVGLGKIGLPLAAQFAGKGLDVIGCDVMSEVVESINRGRSHILEEPGLDERVKKAVAEGRLKATTDTTAATSKADVVVVIVPLMVAADHTMDYRNIDSATQAVARGLRRGTLIVYETTLPVGTTRQRLGPALAAESGLVAGVDFHLAFSPERIYAGRVFDDLRKYPKIVGGIDAASTDKAVEFYRHRPSIGVGGHCIPVYPHFLLQDATDGELSLVRDGRETNDRMAAVGIEQLDRHLGGLGGRRVLVLGASYREDVKELAFSTAFPIVDLLHRAGAIVLIHDPLFTPSELRPFEAEVVDLDSDAARRVDAVVVQAWHGNFKGLDWKKFKNLRVVLDGRGAVEPRAVSEAGAKYVAVEMPREKASA